MSNNPFVTLWHEEMDSNTTQPLSAARHLLNSGWQPADARSAELLGVSFSGGNQPKSTTSRRTTKAPAAPATESSKSTKEGN